MSRVVTWVIALCAATGCDRVFGLNRPDAADPDAPTPIDAAPDAAPDAPMCQGNGHDEDVDGLDDNCDNCPVDPNSDQADGDGDGVGNVCDPNAGPAADKILLFSPFTTTAEYSITGSSAQGTDEIRLGPNTTLTSDSAYLATRVEAGVRYLSPVVPDVIKLYAGNVGSFIDVCLVDLGDPACVTGAPCVGAGFDNFNPNVAAWSGVAATDKLRIDVGTGTFLCTATSSTSSHSASATATVRNGQVGVTSNVTAGDAAVVRYLIVYGH